MASTKIRPGASGAPSAAVASGGEPGAAVPGSMVHAVIRTVSNEPRRTISQPDTVSPSRTSRAPPPPVKIHCAGPDEPATGRSTGRTPGPARTSSETIGSAVEPASASAG